MKKLIFLSSIILLQACGTGNKGSASRETSSTAVYAPVVNSSNGVIQLSWSAGSGVSTGYYVEQSTDSVNWQQIQTVTSGTSTLITGATHGQQYWFRIRAYNSAGTSGYSGVATVTP